MDKETDYQTVRETNRNYVTHTMLAPQFNQSGQLSDFHGHR